MATIATPVHDAYGLRSDSSGRSHLAFAGGLRETDTGWYLSGGRVYNPTLRRFIAPDPTSPFAGGGINRYAYCGGDPINRVDPSGHSWLNWMGALLGLGGPTGAARSLSSTSRNPYDTTATPSMVATTVAAVTDAMSVTAAIGSVASTTQDKPKAGGLLGWVAMGTTGTAGVQLPEARPGSSRARPFVAMSAGPVSQPDQGDIPRNPNVRLVMDPHIPARRLTSDRQGNPDVRKQWIYGTHIRNDRSSIMAPDSAIRSSDVEELLPTLKSLGITHLNLYTGVHGQAYGRNWYAGTGASARPDPHLVHEDRVHTTKAADSIGITIHLVDLGSMTKQDFRNRLLQDGLHIISTCFGLADDVVMDALNVSHATVFARLALP